MKKCAVTKQIRKSIKKLDRYRRCSSAGMFNTSSAGAVTSLILITMLSFCFGLINPSSINNASAVGSVSLTVSSSTVELNIAPLRATGTFAKSDNITISASTTNSTGYTLSLAASSSTDYNKLKNTSTNTSLTSITSATTEEAFKALSGTAYNGMWGYLPSKYNSTANTDFRPAPTMGGDILDKTSASNSTANTYSLAIGARVDSTVKLGSYSNTYNVILVANEVPYTITYDDNVVSNMPTDISSASSASSVNISSNIPVRDGYTFLGWCTVVPTNNNGTDTCTGGTQYAAGASWTLGASDNNLHLYAMWKEQKTIANSTYLQEVTSCPSSLTTGQTYTLKDSRDQQNYTVAKLADDKCWMTTNLNLAGGTALSADDTDVTSDYISSFTTSNNLTKSGNTIVLPASTTDSGFDTANYSYVANSGNASSNCSSAPGCYSYYSWDAATLGSGRSISTDNTNAEQSICPKGWHLPTTYNGTDSSTDFRALMIALGGSSSVQTYNSSTSPTGATMSSTLQASPNSFLLAGRYYYGSFDDGGSYGYYWSATSLGNTNNARSLLFYSSYVYSARSNYREVGYSVRCVYGS